MKKRVKTLTATEQKLYLTKGSLENLIGKLVSDSYGFSLENQRIELKEQLDFRDIIG